MSGNALSRWIRSRLYSQNDAVTEKKKKKKKSISITGYSLLSVPQGKQNECLRHKTICNGKVELALWAIQLEQECLLLISNTTVEISFPLTMFQTLHPEKTPARWFQYASVPCPSLSLVSLLKYQFGPSTSQYLLCLVLQYLGKWEVAVILTLRQENKE